MKNWIQVAPEGLAEDTDVLRYLRLAIDFVETLPPK